MRQVRYINPQTREVIVRDVLCLDRLQRGWLVQCGFIPWKDWKKKEKRKNVGTD